MTNRTAKGNTAPMPLPQWIAEATAAQNEARAAIERYCRAAKRLLAARPEPAGYSSRCDEEESLVPMTLEDWLRGEFASVRDRHPEELAEPVPTPKELRDSHRRAKKRKASRDRDHERFERLREERRRREEAQSHRMNRLSVPSFETVARAIRRGARSRAEIEAALAKAGASKWSIRKTMITAEVNSFVEYDAHGVPRLGDPSVRRRIMANLRAGDRTTGSADVNALVEKFWSTPLDLTGRPERASAA